MWEGFSQCLRNEIRNTVKNTQCIPRDSIGWSEQKNQVIQFFLFRSFCYLLLSSDHTTWSVFPKITTWRNRRQHCVSIWLILFITMIVMVETTYLRREYRGREATHTFSAVQCKRDPVVNDVHLEKSHLEWGWWWWWGWGWWWRPSLSSELLDIIRKYIPSSNGSFFIYI